MFILFFDHSSSHCCFGQIKWKSPLFPKHLQIIQIYRKLIHIEEKTWYGCYFSKNCLTYYFTILATFNLVAISTICIAFVLLSFGLVKKKSGHIILFTFLPQLVLTAHLQLEGPHCFPHIAGKVSWTKSFGNKAW